MVTIKDETIYLPENDDFNFIKNEARRARIDAISQALSKIDTQGRFATLTISGNPENENIKFGLLCDFDDLITQIQRAVQSVIQQTNRLR